MQTPFRLVTISCAVAVLATMPLSAQPQSAATPAKSVVVLDAACMWRAYQVLKPPVIQIQGTSKPFMSEKAFLNWETAEPAADWTDQSFDDRTWLGGPANLAAASPYLARLCLRGLFTVDDPAKVSGLAVSLSYHGGAIVYVNGQEVGRGHVPVGARGDLVSAEPYPRETYVTDKDELVPGGWVESRYPKQLALRKRTLQGIAIPTKFLRQGTNVLAIEIIRAQYHEVIDEKKPAGKEAAKLKKRGCPYVVTWNTCQFLDVQLTATGADGLVPKAPRPNGLQVRNSDPLLASNRESEFSNQPERLHPVTIAGARNGSFCGKVIVGSAQPIKDLKVTPSDLKCATGAIPASSVLIRYGTPWGSDMDKVAKPAGLDILLESPLKEFPVRKNGAVVAVWMKVKVPARSPAGDYQGKVTIEAQGSKPLEVPVTVKVADWSLPDAQDYLTWVDLIQSPDSLALEYDVPLWSDKHWELIGRSMDYLNEVGSRIVYLPLICHTNLGNEQSMVRWIRKGETGYEYDFSIMEKYLDIVEKHMGKPKIVVLQAWEIYLRGDDGKNLPAADGGWHEYVRRMREARMALNGKGPAVTVVDPATGKLETEYLPPYKDPAAKGLWQPVFAELRKRLARRGMAEAMMLGLSSDAWPSKEEVVLLHELSGGLPWVSQSHGGSHTGILGFPYSGDGMYGVAKVGYATNVWDLKFVLDPSKGRSYGWKLPYLVAQHDRFGYINTVPLSTLRSEPEFNITGYQRGVGRIGADLWFVIRNNRGQRVGMVPGRYPQSNWRNLDLGASILAPGPDRPVASARYENLREGVQECEARIFIEQALIDETPKANLSDDLAKRCQEALDERLRYMWKGTSTLKLMGRGHEYATDSSTTGLWRYAAGVAGHYWFLGSAWQKRNEKLFALAGEVQKAIRQK